MSLRMLHIERKFGIVIIIAKSIDIKLARCYISKRTTTYNTRDERITVYHYISTYYYLFRRICRVKLLSKKNKPLSAIVNLFGSLKKKDVQDSGSETARAPKMKKPKKKRTIIIICIVVIIAVILGLKSCNGSKGKAASNATYTTSTVVKSDISSTLNGTGTLKPANSYDVTALATGKILSADFEEGDIVESGSILYQIDKTDAETNIKSAELNLEKSKLSYNNILKTQDNLNVTAPESGKITTLNVQVGDNVASGATIGTIKDSSTMSLAVPFNSSDVDSFYLGESANVTLDSTFETLPGTISKISGTEQILTGNMLVRYVTIDVTNPGGIAETTVGTAIVGNIACNSSASFKYKSSQSIIAKASGTVDSIVCDEGSAVSKGTVILKLTSDDIEGNIMNAKLSLEDAQNALDDKMKALDNYTITSPISGTVTSKKSKAGDKLGSGSSSTANSTLCTILDLSYLTVEMSVDELDIKKVSVGQKVTVTVEAAGDQTYTGVVTKVNISGTTTNGVTAYPVTVRIDDTDGLLPGMNVSTSIVVESVTNVLAVPVNAVVRGNQVLVKKDSSTASTDSTKILTTGTSGIPDGFEYVDVTLGINNSELIEIKSGLSEGDIIAVPSVSIDPNMMYAASGSDVEGDSQSSQSSSSVQVEG